MDVVLPKPASYVVAVSGGVDSMALLDMLRLRAVEEPGWKLVVAHLDHGIRDDSAKDRQLVQGVAKVHKLPFVYKEAKLGAGTSEAKARQARYEFLRQTLKASEGQAIITAHHQDDVLETAIINMLRGSGRKGLTSLGNQNDLLRPLLGVSKSELVAYAKDQGLQWREDSTNQDDTYLRNYVRLRLLPRFNEVDRAQLLNLINGLSPLNEKIDGLLVKQLNEQPVKGAIDRIWFNHLPHVVAREVLAAWLRANDSSFDKKTLERLVVAAKTAIAGKRFPVQAGLSMEVLADRLALTSSER
jgi:tRNA(Ile)-lysidine synthetase-like protein